MGRIVFFFQEALRALMDLVKDISQDPGEAP